MNKAARDALRRMAQGKFHNATSATIATLWEAGLCSAEGERLTPKGKARAEAAEKRRVAAYHRSRHVGGNGLPK